MNRSSQFQWPAESEAVLRRALAIVGTWRWLLDTLPASYARRVAAFRAGFMPGRILDAATERYAGFLANQPTSQPDSARQLACDSHLAHSIADAMAWAAGRTSPVELCQSWQLTGWEHLPNAEPGSSPGAVIVVPRLTGWGMACRALMLYRPKLTLMGPVFSRELLREASYQLARGHEIAWLVEPTLVTDGKVSISEEAAELATATEAPLLAVQATRLDPVRHHIEVSPALAANELLTQLESWVAEQPERWPWGTRRWQES